jgi:hypothetical protein
VAWLRPVSPSFGPEMPWGACGQSLHDLLLIHGLHRPMLDPLILRLLTEGKGGATAATLTLHMRHHLRRRGRLLRHAGLAAVEDVSRQRGLARAVALGTALSRPKLLALSVVRTEFLHFVYICNTF